MTDCNVLEMTQRPSKPNFEEFSICLVEEKLDSFPACEHGPQLSLLGLLPYLFCSIWCVPQPPLGAALSWVSSTITGQLGEGKRSNEMWLIYTPTDSGEQGKVDLLFGNLQMT